MADNCTTRRTPACSQAREQRSRAVGMHAGGRVARAVLQHPGAIHHRVDADQVRQPVGRTGGFSDVERDKSCRFRQPGGGAGVAGDRHHRVALAMEGGQHRLADQAGRPRQQHAQDALLSGPTPVSVSGLARASTRGCPDCRRT